MVSSSLERLLCLRRMLGMGAILEVLLSTEKAFDEDVSREKAELKAATTGWLVSLESFSSVEE